VAAGGVVTNPHVRNGLLKDYLEAKGGVRSPSGTTRNAILCEIISLLIVIDCNLKRNPLLYLWESALEGNIFGDPWNDSQTWDDSLLWIETQVGAYSIAYSPAYEIV
jgi:hypothetical protein